MCELLEPLALAFLSSDVTVMLDGEPEPDDTDDIPADVWASFAFPAD